MSLADWTHQHLRASLTNSFSVCRQTLEVCVRRIEQRLFTSGGGQQVALWLLGHRIAAARSWFAEASVRKQQVQLIVSRPITRGQVLLVKAHSATGSGVKVWDTLLWVREREKERGKGREKHSFGGERTMRKRERRRKVGNLRVLFFPFFESASVDLWGRESERVRESHSQVQK